MKTYVTVQGDTWDKISKEVYGNEKYADYLMSSNYDNLESFIFASGVILEVPDLPEEASLEQPSWRI